jgi:hypothetical protein
VADNTTTGAPAEISRQLENIDPYSWIKYFVFV